MAEFLDILKQYGAYIALPVIIAYFMQVLKSKVPFFASVLGLRLVHFIPLLLGLAGGFLLPEETWQAKLLIGGALGCVSHLIYKTLTVSLASTSVVAEKSMRKTMDLSEVAENKVIADVVKSEEV
jgi:hypothetical protein